MNTEPKMAFFLHMYQPPFPVQTPAVLDRIINNSYIPLTKALLETDHKLSININGSLTEMLIDQGKEGKQVISNLKGLYDKGQIEILESGAYHPIFPLIPDDNVIHQIKLNKEINSKVFGSNYQPQGVFPPELAFDQRTAILIKNLGFNYALASEYTFESISYRILPYIRASGKKNFFIIRRNRFMSNDFAFKNFKTPMDFKKAVLDFIKNENTIPVVGMDFETFGEHHPDYIPFLMECLNLIEPLTLADYIEEMKNNNRVKEIEPSQIKANSWSTDPNDYNRGIPFPLWDNSENTLHQLILTLMDILKEALHLLDEEDRPLSFYKSQQSCQLWWCARRGAPDLIRRASIFQLSALEDIKKKSLNYSIDKKQAINSLLAIADNLVKRINLIIDNEQK